MTTTDKTIERYIERAIDRFLTDPPDSDFQRGYFDALIVIYREAMGRNDERLDAALKLRIPRPLADSGPSRTVIPAHRGQHSGDRGQFLMSV